jgi:hypothetical protein
MYDTPVGNHKFSQSTIETNLNLLKCNLEPVDDSDDKMLVPRPGMQALGLGWLKESELPVGIH